MFKKFDFDRVCVFWCWLKRKDGMIGCFLVVFISMCVCVWENDKNISYEIKVDLFCKIKFSLFYWMFGWN